jgi:thioesterase domain-containing protein
MRRAISQNPSRPVMEVLLPIWQRVLQRTSIRATDNFFDLGGTASSAARLFAEIAEAFGRDLPPVMICAAPTIETLAALLEEPTPPRIPPLLLLKAGTEHPPVFIAHGLGGDVLGLADLVGKIESRHPIYGMQSRGIDGIDEPIASMDQRAQFHLDAIKQLQPHGPYFLIGYSLGGLATLEIAQRMSAQGEKIALLALVDTYPDKNHLSVVQSALLTVRQAKRRAGTMIKWALGRAQSQSPGNGGDGGRRPSVVIAQVAQRMREADYSAGRGYHPRFYGGRVRFVKAGINGYFPYNPTAVWAHLVKEFDLETTPGDHVGLVTTHCKDLGSVLSRYLQESDAEGSGG